MESLPGLWSLTPYGAVLGLLVFNVLAVVRGTFIPRATHERELEFANRRGDEWKETAQDGRRIIAAQEKQIAALLEANKIAGHFFKTVDPEAGDADVG